MLERRGGECLDHDRHSGESRFLLPPPRNILVGVFRHDITVPLQDEELLGHAERVVPTDDGVLVRVDLDGALAFPQFDDVVHAGRLTRLLPRLP